MGGGGGVYIAFLKHYFKLNLFYCMSLLLTARPFQTYMNINFLRMGFP